MFNLWKRIEEKGALAIPDRPEALSRLEWAEVSERYPNLVLPECAGYDIRSDERLRFENPFVRVGTEYRFRVPATTGTEALDVYVDLDPLLGSLGAKDYSWDEEDRFGPGGILSCSCGVPGCDGIWYQSFHMSERMVRWDVLRYESQFELFFERRAYEEGVVRMLHDLFRPSGETVPWVGNWVDGWTPVAESIAEFLVRRPDYADIWVRLGFEPMDKGSAGSP